MAELKFKILGDLKGLEDQIKKFAQNGVKLNLKSDMDSFFKGMSGGVMGKPSPAGGAGGLGSLLGRGGLLLTVLGAIKNSVTKMLDHLAESSASLKAVRLIQQQSYKIFMKPFGDFLGTLLKPMSMWLLKMAIRFNQLFGTQTTTDAGEAAKVTGAKETVGFATGAVAGATAGGIAGAAGLGVGAVPGALIGGTIGALAALWPQIKKGVENIWLIISEWFEVFKEGFVTFFTKTLPEALGKAWDATKKFFMDTLPEALGEMIGHIQIFFTKTLPEFFTKTIPNALSNAWQTVWDFFTVTLPDTLAKAWESVYKWFTVDVVNFFTTTVPTFFANAWKKVSDFFTVDIPKAFDGLFSYFTNLVNKVKSIYSSIKDKVVEGYNKVTGQSSGKPTALGGIYDTRTTLQVGERGPEAVIPLSKLGSLNSGGSQTINVSGNTFRDRDDIDYLVRQIKDTMRTQARMRTSYGVF